MTCFVLHPAMNFIAQTCLTERLNLARRNRSQTQNQQTKMIANVATTTLAVGLVLMETAQAAGFDRSEQQAFPEFNVENMKDCGMSLIELFMCFGGGWGLFNNRNKTGRFHLAGMFVLLCVTFVGSYYVYKRVKNATGYGEGDELKGEKDQMPLIPEEDAGTGVTAGMTLATGMTPSAGMTRTAGMTPVTKSEKKGSC